ncbi:helix-turn-helix domain-containing protein [Anaerobutyricum hallii]|uniref:XRE family transcriptional regulator n=1 Tax=Anaerobutyricum hallii TaxID=39488 RepID=A0A415TQD5_9FIRM|nr:XRE family transcriptional regulator [Anaerobutyricum hallii]
MPVGVSRQKLRQIRKEKNLTQKDVASQTGLSQQMVSKIESFNGNPSMLSFLKYCNCIGVDVNYPPPKGSGLLLNGSPD